MMGKLASSKLQHMFAVALLCLGVVIAATACGSSTSTSTSPSPAPSDLGGMPIYQPSTVVSRDDDRSTVLHTSDSVDNVTSFYGDTVKTDGCQTVSSSTVGGAANFTVKRSGKGVTIAIARTGSETTISLSAYPTG